MIALADLERLIAEEATRYRHLSLVDRALANLWQRARMLALQGTGINELVVLGEILRQRRLSLGLTQEEVSWRSGITRVHICRVELATPYSKLVPYRPRRRTLERWCRALRLIGTERDEVMRAAGYAQRGEHDATR